LHTLQAVPVEAKDAVSSRIPVFAPGEDPLQPALLSQDQAAYLCRLALLEKLGEELADQRLQLVEHCELLVRVEDNWQHDRADGVAELGDLSLQLHRREEVLRRREQSLHDRERTHESAEQGLRRRYDEVQQEQLRLEGLQVRLNSRERSYEAERQRLLACVRAREALVRGRILAMADLRKQWIERQRQEIRKLRTELEASQAMRARFSALWAEYLRRSAMLEHEERSVAERAHALEHLRLECTGQSQNPAAAERRLERWRRRCAAVSAAATGKLAHERTWLQEEADRLKRYGDKLDQQAAALHEQETELLTKRTTWENEQRRTSQAADQLHLELKSLRAQRGLYERQLQELRGELERVAQSMLGERGNEPSAIQAA
jgi:hypothetical protein